MIKDFYNWDKERFEKKVYLNKEDWILYMATDLVDEDILNLDLDEVNNLFEGDEEELIKIWNNWKNTMEFLEVI